MEDNKFSHVEHYNRGKFECIDVIEDITSHWSGPTSFRLGNVIKYIWRHQDKQGQYIASLQKALYYLEREIEYAIEEMV